MNKDKRITLATYIAVPASLEKASANPVRPASQYLPRKRVDRYIIRKQATPKSGATLKICMVSSGANAKSEVYNVRVIEDNSAKRGRRRR
jgi:hypothetical protein